MNPEDQASAGITDAGQYLDALAGRPPARRFESGAPGGFAAWREEFRGWLAGLFSVWEEAGRQEDSPQVEILGRRGWHGCTRVELLLRGGDPECAVPATILEPAHPRKGAAIVCQHGHGFGGRLSVIGDGGRPEVAAEIPVCRYDYGLRLAQAGYFVLAADLMGFGARAGDIQTPGRDACDMLAHFLALHGRCLLALHVAEVRRGIGVLASWPGVDAQRLGLCGLSYGGRLTMFTAALDERVRAAVASGSCNTYRDRVLLRQGACGAQILPGLLPDADTPDVFASIAPRPLQVQWGSRDPLIPAEPAEEGIAHLERCYQAAGAPDRLVVDRFDGGHEFDVAPALDWFARWL